MAKGQHITVELVGGAPWGFRLGGGADFGCPLEIAKLRKKSKADQAGLAEGDVVTVVDNQDVTQKSHQDAMKIIDVAGDRLVLKIIKGAGPSAQFNTMNSTQPPIEATIVRSREPSISRSFTVRSREPSASRTLTVLTQAANKAEPLVSTSKPQFRPQQDPWTVDVTSYQMKPQPQKVPLASPTVPRNPKFNAYAPKSAPVAVGDQRAPSSCPVLTPWTAPPENPALNPVAWQPTYHHNHEPVVVPIKPMEQKSKPQVTPFKVTKAPVGPPQRWQPTNIQVVAPQAPVSTDNYDGGQQLYEKRTSNIPVPPPLEPEMMKPDGHIPGMVNPLIYDDSQGVFEPANTAVNPGNEFNHDEHSKSSQKKIYSDSAFYDAPGMGYPTIHEQVALCKQIATFLDSSQNQRSRGGRMFMKRKQKSQDYSIESQGRRYEAPNMGRQFDTMESMYDMHRGYNQVRHHPDPIKQQLNQAELEKIQHNREALCKHDELPPNLAFDVNSALALSHGKAAQIFARRKERAEKYTVDESNVRRQPHQNVLQYQVTPGSIMIRSQYTSPWDAAAQGNMEEAFASFDPFAANATSQPQRDLEYQTSHSVLPASAKSATFGVKYKPFNKVPPPSGLPGSSTTALTSRGQVEMIPAPKNRLSQMIANPESGTGMSQSMNEKYLNTYQSSPGDHMTSTASVTLRRPKEFSRRDDIMSASMYEPRPVQQQQATVDSGSAGSFNLMRPKQFMSDSIQQPLSNSVHYSPSTLANNQYNTAQSQQFEALQRQSRQHNVGLRSQNYNMSASPQSQQHYLASSQNAAAAPLQYYSSGHGQAPVSAF